MGRKESGAVSFEYAMLVALLAVVAIVSVRQFGRRLACTFGFINYAMEHPEMGYADARANQPNMTINGDVVDC